MRQDCQARTRGDTRCVRSLGVRARRPRRTPSVAFGAATRGRDQRRRPEPRATKPPHGAQGPETTTSCDPALPHGTHGAAGKRRVLAAALANAGEQAVAARCAGAVLTVREVAARLRISTATVYALCRDGKLEHHRVSNAIRISERALVDYLEAPPP